MRRATWIVMLVALLMPGCGLLGITSDQAVQEVAKLKLGIDGMQQALDNAAKMDGVRKDVAGVCSEILKEAETQTLALADVATFLTMPTPTKDDYLVAVGRLSDANASAGRVAELTKAVDVKFGTTALPPDLQAELLRLRDSSKRLLERIETTAARVKAVSVIITKAVNLAGGIAGGVAGGGSGGVLGIITAIGAAAATVGAAADQLKNGGKAA